MKEGEEVGDENEVRLGEGEKVDGRRRGSR